MPIDQADLYFRQGSSDKEYHCQLEQSGGGYVVNFQYGRRGSTLTTGTKTASPVTLDKARSVFNKLVSEKTAKGYTPSTTGAGYSQTPQEARVTGILPQLLNSIDESRLEELLRDDNYVMQEKKDGRRILVKKEGGHITGINRKGLEVGIPQVVIDTLQVVPRDFVIDGEMIGETYHVFDMLSWNGSSIESKAYIDRYAALDILVSRLKSETIRIVDIERSEETKREALNELMVAKAEGVVFKDENAPYTVGRPASGGTQLKYKFTETCTCQVLSQNGTKRSVALGMLSGAALVPVGNVTIPANFQIPEAGNLVEIRYLYAYPGGSLYQPVYLGERDDVPVDHITVLKLKQDTEDDDQ